MATTLNDIVFVDSDMSETLSALIALYKEYSGRTLAQGDPVRLFLCTIAAVIIQLKELINYTGKMNLLAYATGDYLDHLGALVGVERTEATAATTTVKITLSAERGSAVVVPAGTRITAGDNVFFAIDEAVTIAAGETEAEASATCTEPGEAGNGYAVGELDTIVDPIAFVASMVNTTESEGGADIEDDDSFRERIRLAPESFSVAGPYGAYEYYAKSASSLICDVAVTSPAAGEVDIRPLLEGGELPGAEILEAVYEACNDDSVRPLTDYVTVAAPDAASYNVELTYYISRSDSASASAIQTAVESAVDGFVSWQSAVLGRDINPSELIRRVMAAGAKRVEVTEPEFTVVNDTAVALAESVTVNLGGLEDD